MYWELTGRPSSRRSTFPLYATKPKDIARHSGFLKLPAKVQTIIEGVQPYNGPHGYRAHRLWMLNRLWNDDKHRFPSIVGWIFVPYGYFVIHKGKCEIKVFPGPLHDDKVIARVKRVGDEEIEFEPHIAFDIAFYRRGPARGQGVRNTLIDLYQTVRKEVFATILPDTDATLERLAED